MKNFSLNDNGTISVHYDNLNPAQVEELISTLQGNLWFMKSKREDPIDVMKKSAKLSRARGELSFRLSWDAEEIVINLDDEFLPSPPNIDLSDEDLVRYNKTLKDMLTSV